MEGKFIIVIVPLLYMLMAIAAICYIIRKRNTTSISLKGFGLQLIVSACECHERKKEEDSTDVHLK